MSLNTVPRFIEHHVIGMGQVSSANTGRDGSGDVVTVLVGGTDGTLISLVRVQAIVTTTAGMVRLFIDDGSNVRLLCEIPIDAVSVGANVEGFSAEWVPTRDLVLPSGWELQASTHNAEAINVFAFGGGY